MAQALPASASAATYAVYTQLDGSRELDCHGPIGSFAAGTILPPTTGKTCPARKEG